jgi:hypothetical protein
MVHKRIHKSIKEAMLTKPTETLDVLLETNMEEQEDHKEQEDHDDQEQHSIVLFTPEQLEVLLKNE